MKIADIRRAIDSLYYTIRDLQGHTRDEFLARDVPAVLLPKINGLSAINIKPRSAADANSRANAIRQAVEQIGKWQNLRSISQVTVAKLEEREASHRASLKLIINNTRRVSQQ